VQAKLNGTPNLRVIKQAAAFGCGQLSPALFLSVAFFR
jgi:hypothetical protein